MAVPGATFTHRLRPRRPRTRCARPAPPALIAAGLYVVTALTAYADDLAAPTTATPIEVESDSFEVRLDDERAIWRGSVSARQGNYTFTASQLTLHLDQITGPAEGPGDATESGPDGTVSTGYELSAERLSYDFDRSLVVGDGDSVLRRGPETIRADRITYSVSQRTAYALPADNGRVLVRFYSNPDQPVFPGAALAAAGPAAE